GVRFDTESRERLGVRMPGAAKAPAATAPSSDAGAAQTGASASGLSFDLPATWTELPPQQFRDANFRAGDGVECYVTMLGGDGGGLLANVNRWRGQIGLQTTDAASLVGLPTVPMLGGEATLVELVGE